ncbi:MAG TPA: hypothetical protein VF933_17225 [Streptosporangiaceae bacterium]
MSARLNKQSCAFAQDQIGNGHVVLDQRDDWSEHQPCTRQENEFIESHGWDQYGHWHLGIDDEASERTKARYKYSCGRSGTTHHRRQGGQRHGLRPAEAFMGPAAGMSTLPEDQGRHNR